MQNPLVSVVIPVYNGADYLKEAIDSVLHQTYKNIEIIVVNDGSEDDGETEQIALSYGNKIHYLKKKNGGVSTALNEGIRKMKGEYFAWLSHDDVFYPDKVQRQLELLLQKDAKITACSYNIFTDTGRRIPVPIVDFYGEENLKKNVFSVINAIIQFGGILMHRSILEKYGNFREDLRTTQDYEFLFRVLREEQCVYSNELLYGIRYHEKQGSNTIKSVECDRDEMYVMFLETLTEEEQCVLYGSCYNFYYQMLLRIFSIPNMRKSYEICLNGLIMNCGEKIETESYPDIPVWIYGAGMYGRRFLFDLRCRGIQAEGFIDGNSRLEGTLIDGIPCFSLESLIEEKRKGQIVIASIYREEIADELRQYGVENFLYKEEFDRKTTSTPPEWETVKENIERYEKNGWR